MPWSIQERDGEFCVIKDDDGSNEGCHDSRSEAEAQLRALYASEMTMSGISFADDGEVAASFKANVEKRTITGLMVPWGKVARSGFAKWKFAPGSLHWATERRVKLNLGHERKDTVGVAVRLEHGPTGLTGSFRVAPGSKGDEALSLASEGVLDGFSIEVDFDEGDEWTPDPENKAVRLVRKAALRGVALTGYPAFDDARVERIAAARQEVNMEPEETIIETTEEPKFETVLESWAGKIAESQEKLMESVGDSISAGFRAALEDMSQPQGPEPVKAARFSTLREPSVYRFDGTGDSMVKDAWAAVTDKDEDAIERLRKFRRQSEDVASLVRSTVAFAPQTTTTAAAIVPPGYRPDLYVAELQKGRPLVGLASRGTISNATPFTVPTFTSSTSVSADHVEGTNPSDGSVDLDTLTVTPVAVSGRLVLTREIVDAANPAIDQIAFATMRESYARQTEGKVYTLLNGASGAGGTITAGFVPSGAQAATTASGTGNQTLVTNLRSAIAAYPFARFAFPNGAAMGQAATQKLATAVDTAQRPLFPWVGPQNAYGTGNATEGGWVVDGLTFTPAWAMTGVAAGDSQIFLVNSADLWVWESPLLSFRFEEKQGPANIELNIFGYFACHLLRPVGLSGLRIT